MRHRLSRERTVEAVRSSDPKRVMVAEEEKRMEGREKCAQGLQRTKIAHTNY